MFLYLYLYEPVLTKTNQMLTKNATWEVIMNTGTNPNFS